MRRGLVAAVLRGRSAAAVGGGYTISNVATSTGSITTALGAVLTVTIIAISGSATGRVYAGDGTPVGDISGAVGETFVIALPADINAYRVDWVDAVGSLSFTVN